MRPRSTLGVVVSGVLLCAPFLAGIRASGATTRDDDADGASCAGAIAVMASEGSAGATQPAQMNWARVALDTFNAEHGSSFSIEPSNVNDETAPRGH